MLLATPSNPLICSEPLRKCNKCDSPLEKDIEIKSLNIKKRVPVICLCRDKEIKAEEQKESELQIQRRLNKFNAYNLMDDKFSKSTFKNWQVREDNKKIFELGKKYCDNWETMFKQNYGLILSGKAGCGKTYLSFAIANEILSKGHSVMAISVSRLVKAIQDSFGDDKGIREMELLKAIGDTKLLILDDLGTENKTAWAYEKLYSIIDTRYRSGKPLIITTNFSKTGLAENLAIVDNRKEQIDHSDRIHNRLLETCSFINIQGESWRGHKGIENKKRLFEQLGL